MRKCFNNLLFVTLAAVTGCASNPSEVSARSETQKPTAPSKATESAMKSTGSPSKATVAKPSKPKTFQQRLNALMDAQWKSKVNNRVAIAELIKFRDEVAGTNRADRVLTELRVLGKCKMNGGWTRLALYDKTLADIYVPQLCKPAINDATLPLSTRIDYAEHYCLWLAGDKHYDETDRVSVRLLDAALKAYKEPKPAIGPNIVGRAYFLKAMCRRWRDDYDGAMSAYRESMKYYEIPGREKATQLALEFDRPAEALALWDGVDAYAKISFFGRNRRGYLVRDLARDYAMCPTNTPARRSEIVNSFFLTDKSPDAAKIRAAVRDVYIPIKGSDWWIKAQIGMIYEKYDWPFFVEVYEYARMKSLDNPGGHRAYVFSLAASGQTAKAIAKASEYLKDEKLDKKERARLEALKSVIEDKDALVPLAAIKDEPKPYAEAVRDTATWCLTLEKNDACRRYSEAYQKLVKPQPRRHYALKWFDTPVTSISDWRRVYDQLEKTYADIKMCGDLDNLVTDVATGRITVEKTEKDSNSVQMEVTSLCDVNGVSIFLRVEDPNARQVERGFAGGIATEMYFAPGDNQPYVCFGSEPRTGIGFSFQTMYENIDCKRLNVKGVRDRYSLVSEVGFSDTDYVLRLFFPWDAFYQKLPKKGTEWKFECLAFGPKGGYSWGGAQGVHEASSWGRLVFGLTDAQLRAIKRRLIYATYKNWNVASHGEVAPFDKWADPVIGDPDFYKYVKPLETELVGYQKRVTANLSDAEVDEIYEKGVIRWLGIRHELDKLRVEYLMTR